MSGNTIAFIEMLIPFALVLAVLTWQLVVTNRAIREDQARPASEPPAPAVETAPISEAAPTPEASPAIDAAPASETASATQA